MNHTTKAFILLPLTGASKVEITIASFWKMARAKVFIFQFVQKDCSTKPKRVIFVNLNKSEISTFLNSSLAVRSSRRQIESPELLMMQVMQDRILMQDRIMYQVSHSLIGCVSIYRQICGFFSIKISIDWLNCNNLTPNCYTLLHPA